MLFNLLTQFGQHSQQNKGRSLLSFEVSSISLGSSTDLCEAFVCVAEIIEPSPFSRAVRVSDALLVVQSRDVE